MIGYVFFVFSVIVSATGGEGGTTAAYKPTDVFLFNCGATSNTSDTNGRTWTTEQQKDFASSLANASFSSNASKLNQTVPLVPYMTARIFISSFTYSFPVSPGWKFLRLYFYPTRYGSRFNAVDSFFDVTVNSFTLLKNFSVYLPVYASNSEFFIKEFIVPVHTKLILTFAPSPNSFAFVNGIEIVSMPDWFYTKGGFNGYIREVGGINDLDIDNTTALETVCRLNVGGKMVSDVEDTGMFRRWLPDNDYLLSENAGREFNIPGVKINYTEETPAYVAPENVYTTARSMGNPQDPSINLSFNLTWLFEVDAGFNYLVRLHFCETLKEVTKAGQRIFSIFIGNQVAQPETDVISMSGGSRIPMFLDFSTFVASQTNKSGEISTLQLDLSPYEDGNSMYYDSILNGIEILKLNDSHGNLFRYNPPATLEVKKLHVLMIILGSAIGLLTFIFVVVFFMCQRKRKKNSKDNSVLMSKVLLNQYTYAQVKKITKSFSHIVGKGGFGTVYGGSLSNGRKVAIKLLKDSNGNGEDFINEVASMSQTSHVNIVSLLGFCFEGSKRAIVYEFLENGSLDRFISKNNSLTLDVTTLYGIALGVARGVEYLHYGCKTRIVHFDIKPQNILLDGNLCPKVSDFGLAKLCEKRESIVSLIDARGTIGYIAPEVFSGMYGRISHKSDVYSYGMLVLEMIGARNREVLETKSSNASSVYFPDWIYKDLENGEQSWILSDEITEEDKEISKKMITVALWCIQPRPSDRPSMNRVVEMMEGSLDALEIPSKSSMHFSTELINESSSLSIDEEVE